MDSADERHEKPKRNSVKSLAEEALLELRENNIYRAFRYKLALSSYSLKKELFFLPLLTTYIYSRLP